LETSLLELTKKALADPAWFCREILGVEPWQKQLQIFEALKAHEKTLIYSCVASGKTFAAASIIPWWLMTRHPARVFTVAPTERQLKINVWGELGRILPAARVPMGGELATLNWKLGEGWYAKGFSPKDALAVFGIHGPNDLVLFDDAQGVGSDIIEAFENTAAGGTTKFLFLCNPTFVSGPLYDAITSKRGGMHAIQIDAMSTPNVQAGRVVVPGLITAEKVKEWTDKYGWDSNFVRVKVRALPPRQEPDTLIPIDWLELARAREVPAVTVGACVGQDVARFGDDDSVTGVKLGRQYIERPEWVVNGNDLMQVTGLMMAVVKEFQADQANVDVVGLGAGVADRGREVCREQKIKCNVRDVNVAEKAREEHRFVNKRAEMWWAARESLDPKNKTAMSLMGCTDELVADLSAMKYAHRSDGRIEVESKEETKKRLLRSPDRGDAYAMSVFESYMEGTRPAVVFANKPGLPRSPTWL
jgi:phage terminase large subunit